MKTTGLALLLALGTVPMAYAGQQKKAPAQPPAPAVMNDNAVIEQIAASINDSEEAVTCQLRTPDWRQAVLAGWAASVNMNLPDEDDDQRSLHLTKILRAAKVNAALHARFEETPEQCADFKAGTAKLHEMDSAAHIGMISPSVNQ
jgi:hypothetical protein